MRKTIFILILISCGYALAQKPAYIGNYVRANSMLVNDTIRCDSIYIYGYGWVSSYKLAKKLNVTDTTNQWVQLEDSIGYSGYASRKALLDSLVVLRDSLSVMRDSINIYSDSIKNYDQRLKNINYYAGSGIRLDNKTFKLDNIGTVSSEIINVQSSVGVNFMVIGTITYGFNTGSGNAYFDSYSDYKAAQIKTKDNVGVTLTANSVTGGGGNSIETRLHLDSTNVYILTRPRYGELQSANDSLRILKKGETQKIVDDSLTDFNSTIKTAKNVEADTLKGVIESSRFVLKILNDSSNIDTVNTLVFRNPIPANTLKSNGDIIRFSYTGLYANTLGSQKWINLYINDTLFYTNANAYYTQGDDSTWVIEGDIIRVSSTTAKVAVTKMVSGNAWLPPKYKLVRYINYSNPFKIYLGLDTDNIEGKSNDITAKYGLIKFEN